MQCGVRHVQRQTRIEGRCYYAQEIAAITFTKPERWKDTF